MGWVRLISRGCADSGFPSVCCEYVLLAWFIKNAASTYGRIKPGWKSEKRYIKKGGGVEEMSCNCQRRQMLESYQ